MEQLKVAGFFVGLLYLLCVVLAFSAPGFYILLIEFGGLAAIWLGLASSVKSEIEKVQAQKRQNADWA
jgi:hypothetical protein